MFLVEGEKTIFSSKEEAITIAKNIVLKRKRDIYSATKSILCKQGIKEGNCFINDEIKDEIMLCDIESIIKIYKENEQIDNTINEESEKLIKNVQYVKD